VEAVVHAVHEVNVGNARFAVHDLGPSFTADPGVRSQIGRADVCLGFENAARAIAVNQDAAQHVTGNLEGCARVKIPSEDAQRLRPASWASRIASATSRIDLREFMLSRWMRRNASASLRFWLSINTPFARSTSLRVSSVSCVWARSCSIWRTSRQR